jgi:hypothetical protein
MGKEGIGIPKWGKSRILGLRMRSDRPDQAGEHDVSGADAPACLALVPVTPPARRITRGSARPDPIFVAHLIATAAQVPQTRNLRRAAPSDALSAYTAQPRPPATTGSRTRQVI